MAFLENDGREYSASASFLFLLCFFKKGWGCAHRSNIFLLGLTLSAPHTWRLEARSCCGSCHRSDTALGIIHDYVAHPEHPDWTLPQGWIEEDQKNTGSSSNLKAEV